MYQGGVKYKNEIFHANIAIKILLFLYFNCCI